MVERGALADRLAITDKIYRYSRSVDRIDPQIGYSVWHNDGTADYGEDIYQGSGHGFIDWCCESHRKALAHSHQMTNVIIDLDGDRASSETYAIVTVRFKAPDAGQIIQYMAWSRYLDKWSCRAGIWAIDDRFVVIDFDETRLVTPGSKVSRGSRDHRDPSYARRL
jgi:SnoaL-like domain